MHMRPILCKVNVYDQPFDSRADSPTNQVVVVEVRQFPWNDHQHYNSNETNSRHAYHLPPLVHCSCHKP